MEMPYILRKRATGEVFTRLMRNVYDLEYYGAAAWETNEAATAALSEMEDNEDAPEAYEPVAITDNQLKLCNVKLNNNLNLRLFLEDDGKLSVRPANLDLH
ncbi:hypothetical protein [Gorillibacterium massiliense]|uniref:hypothetical protein n=1 Tax=Gorillibacterium massiliense TaxID=1280390 RepID=UPI0004B86264|nr:hypothetical protein [Gorillibacterium massiliense]